MKNTKAFLMGLLLYVVNLSMILKKFFKSLLQRIFPNLRQFWQIRKGIVLNLEEIKKLVESAPALKMNSINTKPFIGIVKDGINYNNHTSKTASWPKYERFCLVNEIPYEIYDINKSDWIVEAKKFDIILWHTFSSPSAKYIAESKIYILDKVLNKKCFPSFDELWQYEDKSRANFLYQIYEIPNVSTIVTNSFSEAIDIANKSIYPIISKVTTTAGSSGVKKLNTRSETIKYIKRIFGNGAKTPYSYLKQKDYFYKQEFIKDATFDLRIIIVGGKAFGYYRYPRKNDYRASGIGIIEKKAIPIDAIKLAIEVKNKLNSRQMGVDMLYSTKEKRYYIIETSLFNRVDTPVQLMVEGIPGYYDISSDNICFKAGRFWIQELLLELVISEWSKNSQN
jgi:glutathione synthase/RimK-type ligase-like ATP-grasp enzyme